MQTTIIDSSRIEAMLAQLKAAATKPQSGASPIHAETSPNKAGFADFHALSLVNFLIKAHFAEKDRNLINKEAKKTRFPIVALSDQQAVLVIGKKVSVIGSGNREFWNEFREV